MENSQDGHGAALVVVRHPVDGRSDNGKSICEEIKERLKGHLGKVYIYHDATGMRVADIGYAKAFQCLDKDLCGLEVEVVCVVPSLVPRIMALTVVKTSPHVWRIFKSSDEAAAHLSSRGVSAERLAARHEGVGVMTIPMPRAA